MNRSADTCSADLFDGMFTEDSDSDRALYRHCILASDIMQTVGGHIYMKWMKYAAALAVVITLAGCAEKEEDMEEHESDFYDDIDETDDDDTDDDLRDLVIVDEGYEDESDL